MLAPLRTAQSLALFREHVDEFHRIWTMSHELALALATGVPAAWALWRTRRATPLFDLGCGCCRWRWSSRPCAA